MPVAVPRAKYRFHQSTAFDEDVVEKELQAKVFAWLDSVQMSTVIFHVPNGRKLDRLEAIQVRRLGIRRGVADLAVMRDGGRMGWIELKTSKGQQSDDQIVFEEDCARLGHPYQVARSIEQVQQVLVGWGVTWRRRDPGAA